ncbi:thermostable hemolysin [Kitasatospora sp. NBC_01287]|uniref:thermostable hemolysin n=1 Tax=Kitasatospora sp. NBC_01287 TaxID=2903573 RepID=UPI0022535B7D|nr:thermostable hemolysin [Kitasatospora sp. NBC_01287]MCX4745632.1 thermostable hemolysin [Kitasatospora sp. NBC_01287]
MLRITVVPRATAHWLGARELVRTTYADTYGASVSPDPDAFIIATTQDAEGLDRITGCAGVSYATTTEFFSERYLDAPVETAIAARLGVPVERSRVVEIGPLAGRGGAGREMIRLTPIIAWSLGMEYILCTVTDYLRTALQRVGVTFTPLQVADPERLQPGTRDAWGSYYDGRPQTGFIELRALAPLFAEATGRYTFLDPQVGLLSETGGPVAPAAAREVAGRAGR